MKKVTVLTVTYNRGHYNIPSIESILSQSYQDFQYLVVNDGSTDDTKTILDSLHHPNLTIIHQENKGFTNTLVDTLKDVETHYIAIHGSGDISHPQRLEKQLALLDSDESLGAVGCQIKSLTHEGEIIRVVKRIPYLKNPLFHLMKNNYFSHGEVMFRTSAYQKAGGYRRFFKYTQDYDLWLRIASFSNLARVDEILYSQISLPQNSVMSDYKKVEMQAYFAAFAVYLAKQRLDGNLDELEELGEQSFTKFQKSLTLEEKTFIGERIISSGILDYRLMKDHKRLLKIAQRAREINPHHPSALKYLKLAQYLTILDKIGFGKISHLFDNLIVHFLNRKRRKSYSQ